MLKILFSLMLAATSVIITLALVELGISKFLPQTTPSALKTSFPSCYKASDYLPFELQPNCRTIHKTSEFSVVININSLGFRDEEFNLIKTPGKTRILVVGDSFTFGYGVNAESSYPEKTESILNQASWQAEVINAGFASGFSPDSYYAFLRHNLSALKPDMVIFPIFVLNDITDMEYHTQWIATDSSGFPVKIIDKKRFVSSDGYLLEYASPWYYQLPPISDSQSFILAGKTIDSLLAKIRARISPASLDTKTAIHYYACLFANDCFVEMNQLFDRTFSVVSASYQLAKQNGADLVVLLIPADVQVDGTAWEKYQAGRFGLSQPPYPQTRLNAYFDQQNIPHLDLLPIFLRHQSENLFFKQDGHFSLRGNELAAATLADYILKTRYK